MLGELRAIGVPNEELIKLKGGKSFPLKSVQRMITQLAYSGESEAVGRPVSRDTEYTLMLCIQMKADGHPVVFMVPAPQPASVMTVSAAVKPVAKYEPGKMEILLQGLWQDVLKILSANRQALSFSITERGVLSVSVWNLPEDAATEMTPLTLFSVEPDSMGRATEEGALVMKMPELNDAELVSSVTAYLAQSALALETFGQMPARQWFEAYTEKPEALQSEPGNELVHIVHTHLQQYAYAPIVVLANKDLPVIKDENPPAERIVWWKTIWFAYWHGQSEEEAKLSMRVIIATLLPDKKVSKSKILIALKIKHYIEKSMYPSQLPLVAGMPAGNVCGVRVPDHGHVSYALDQRILSEIVSDMAQLPLHDSDPVMFVTGCGVAHANLVMGSEVLAKFWTEMEARKACMVGDITVSEDSD